jgi:hypothetical protein
VGKDGATILRARIDRASRTVPRSTRECRFRRIRALRFVLHPMFVTRERTEFALQELPGQEELVAPPPLKLHVAVQTTPDFCTTKAPDHTSPRRAQLLCFQRNRHPGSSLLEVTPTSSGGWFESCVH